MSRRRHAAFFLFSLAFFAPSYSNYFVSDDYEFLGRIDLAGAGQYFTKSWGYGNEYRPLLAFSYALDAKASGLSPIGYHFSNTVLHTTAALLAGRISFHFGLSVPWSALASVIFLLNPVAHESFLWIAGRPVVLSACFLFSSLLSFLEAAVSESRKSRLFGILACLAFVAGLLTYEGAIVGPVLVFAICAFFPRYRSGRAAAQILALSTLALTYIAFWNLLFQFRITRFPMETSLPGALESAAKAVIRAFHGSHRLEIAPIYAGLLICLLLQRETRKLAAFCAAWFLIAYLPFIIVSGFTDRFAYVGSAAVAIALSAAVSQVWKRSRPGGWLAAAALILFYSLGMQNRIAMWRTAGEIAQSVTRDIKAAKPALPAGSTLVLVGVPDMYQHALVFLTGLERAVRLQYSPNADFSVRRQADPGAPQPVFTFEYRGGRMCEQF